MTDRKAVSRLDDLHTLPPILKRPQLTKAVILRLFKKLPTLEKDLASGLNLQRSLVRGPASEKSLERYVALLNKIRRNSAVQFFAEQDGQQWWYYADSFPPGKVWRRRWNNLTWNHHRLFGSEALGRAATLNRKKRGWVESLPPEQRKFYLFLYQSLRHEAQLARRLYAKYLIALNDIAPALKRTRKELQRQRILLAGKRCRSLLDPWLKLGDRADAPRTIAANLVQLLTKGKVKASILLSGKL